MPDSRPSGAAELLRARLAAQLLSGPPAVTPLAATQRLLAVQAQDPRAVRLALRVRSDVAHVSSVDAALNDGSMVITWLNRGTLHLVAAEDEPWLHQLTTPQLRRAVARRLEQTGVSPAQADRVCAEIVAALGTDGPLTRAELRERLIRADIPVAGQALVHLLFHTTLEGHIVRGPMRGSEQAFVLATDWLGRPLRPAVDRDRALGELALRYLAGHGPADERDLMKWSQLPLRDTRAGFAAVADRIVRRDDGRFALRRTAPPPPLPPPRLLGPFDPVLLGWASRELVMSETEAVVTTNGIIKAIVLVRGRAAGTWRLSGGQVSLELWDDPSGRLTGALAREAAAVARYLAPSVAPS